MMGEDEFFSRIASEQIDVVPLSDRPAGTAERRRKRPAGETTETAVSAPVEKEEERAALTSPRRARVGAVLLLVGAAVTLLLVSILAGPGPSERTNLHEAPSARISPETPLNAAERTPTIRKPKGAGGRAERPQRRAVPREASRPPTSPVAASPPAAISVPSAPSPTPDRDSFGFEGR